MNLEITSDVEIVQSARFSSFDEILFGMSTRRGGVSGEPYGMNLSFNVGDEELNVRKNRELFLGRLGIQAGRLAFPAQHHSSVSVRVSTPGRYASCDALTTNVPQLYLSISVADCIPVFLYDPSSGAIAAIHAGWRGSSEKITLKTVRQMQKDFGSSPDRIVGFVGPGAGDCCYEVGTDVAARFARPLLRTQDGKTFLNLKQENASQLKEAGLKDENMEVHPLCTICSSSLFHSYRRDGKKSGRMMAVLGMRRGS